MAYSPRRYQREIAAALVLGLVSVLIVGCAARRHRETRPSRGVAPSAETIARPKKGAGFTALARPTGGLWAWCWANPKHSNPAIIPMVWVTNHDYAHPAAAARRSLRAPTDRSAAFLWNVAPKLLSTPADACRTPAGTPTAYPSPWLQAGAAAVAGQISSFFRRFKAAGGRVNYLVIDYEAGLTSWQLSPTGVAAIEHDPRFPRLRAELGFRKLASIMVAGSHRRKWNLLMGADVAAALNQAVFKPAMKVYPNIRGSNFGGAIMLPPHVAPDINNHYQPLSCVFGNCQSPAFYGDIGGLAHTTKGGKTYGNSPFAVLRYEMSYLQGVQASSRLPIVPWVAYRSFRKSNGYYKELIYQLALRGCGELLYWNPRAAGGHAGATATDDRHLGSLLAKLRHRLGAKPGPTTAVPAVGWKSDLLVAARRTEGGSVLYRVTVAPRVNEVTVGPLDTLIKTRGRTGFWVAAPAGKPLSFVVGKPSRRGTVRPMGADQPAG